jgi:hypothetical protein
VQLLHDARHFQGAVGVRQPMQIDADGFGFLACEEARHVEAAAVHHAQREIDDAHLHAAIVQIARDRQKSQGVHLEHGRGGDHVAHRTVEDRLVAKIVNARRMQQQQIDPSNHLYANPNQLLTVRIDDVDRAGKAGIEAVDRAQDLERLLWILHALALECRLVRTLVPAASRGPAFQVLGTTA